MTDPFDFAGKHVFVAGGSSGINLGIAEAFARHGANIGLCARKQDKLDAAVAQLSALGVKAAGWACDVRDYAKTEAALAAAAQTFGPIQVLVSGAAGNFPAARALFERLVTAAEFEEFLTLPAYEALAEAPLAP